MTRIAEWLSPAVLVAVSLFSTSAALTAERSPGTDPVVAHQLYELRFNAGVTVDNPFHTYLLRLEVTAPTGKTITLDGFFDGNERGESGGAIWKAREMDP